jgi:Spy/CpxP family protein refolding chaperone
MKKEQAMRRVIIFIGLLMLSLSTMLAQSPGDMDGRGGHYQRGQGKGDFGRLPDVSEEQRAAFQALRVAMEKEAKPLREEEAQLRLDLQKATTAFPADLSEINAIIDKMAVVRTKLAKLRAKNVQEARKLMTEEQRVIFDSQRDKRSQRKGHSEGGRRAR